MSVEKSALSIRGKTTFSGDAFDVVFGTLSNRDRVRFSGELGIKIPEEYIKVCDRNPDRRFFASRRRSFKTFL